MKEVEVAPELFRALERAFYDWWAENGHALDNGVPGDVYDLRLRLNAAFANASTSAFVQDKELSAVVADGGNPWALNMRPRT